MAKKGKRLKEEMTNGEKIRSLSDEELAKFLDGWEVGDMNRGIFFCSVCDGNLENRCFECTEYWLSEEADEEEYSALLRKMERYRTPPVQQGKWDFICCVPGNGQGEIIMCSECGRIIDNYHVERSAHCPYCKARMNNSTGEER